MEARQNRRGEAVASVRRVRRMNMLLFVDNPLAGGEEELAEFREGCWVVGGELALFKGLDDLVRLEAAGRLARLGRRQHQQRHRMVVMVVMAEAAQAQLLHEGPADEADEGAEQSQAAEHQGGGGKLAERRHWHFVAVTHRG